MREKFICAHFATSLHCKIDSKAHFFASPPPLLFRPEISVFRAFPRFEPDFGRFSEETHPFFAPRSPLFSCSFPFWVRLPTIFRWHALVFSRSTVYFLFHSPILNPISGDCLMARHSFQPRNSLFPCFSLYYPTLRALLREISPFIFPSNTFPIRLFPFFILCSTFLFPLISFPPLFPPYLHLPPPLSFSFLPTFPSSSPINERSRAPSRTTRVRVRLHLPTRQEVFVYCLHRFTHLPQSTGHQCIRCEGKQEKAFTIYTTTSQSRH